MSWILPEEEIRRTLREGLNAIREEVTNDTVDALLLRMFSNVDDAKRAEIKKFVSGKEPEITFQYPTEPAHLPCWLIVLGPEKKTPYVGEDGTDVELATGEIVPAHTQRWSSLFVVITYTDNSESTNWLYHLSKWIFAHAVEALSVIFPYGQDAEGEQFVAEALGKDGGLFKYRRPLRATMSYDQSDASAADLADEITGTSISNAEVTDHV